MIRSLSITVLSSTDISPMGEVPPFSLHITGILLYTILKDSRKLVPILPTMIFNSRKRASKPNPLAISFDLATCPSFLASSSFLAVGSSVFSPPGPSFAKNCRLRGSFSRSLRLQR